MTGKGAVILIMGALIIYAMISFNTSEKLTQATEKSVEYFSENLSKNLANSAVGYLISSVADAVTNDEDYEVTELTTREYSNAQLSGTIRYTIKDTSLSGEDLVEIYVESEYSNESEIVVAYVEIPSGGFIPPAVKGAVSTNNPIATLGNLVVDGRNYDLDGNLIPNSGTKGIWTTQTYDQSGNSKVGGTYGGSDYVPSKPGSPDIIDTNATYPGGYPDSPDGVLGGEDNGYPDGTLKSIAQSGINGSQYVTDPNNLTLPYSGVTYVELPDGETWQSADIEGSGILIIHNDALNAIIENLNSGTFTGLIIADDVIHVHTDILGALIGLTPSPSDGNCLGNGTGTIRYSSEALETVTGALGGDVTSKFDYGYGKFRLPVVYWYEK